MAAPTTDLFEMRARLARSIVQMMSGASTPPNAKIPTDAPSKGGRGRRALRWLGLTALALLWAWACGGLHFLAKMPGPLAVLLIPGLPLAFWHWRKWRVLIGVCAAFAVLAMVVLFLRRSEPVDMHTKAWWEANRRPPVLRFDKKAEWSTDTQEVGVQNVRHFKWRTREDFVPSWSFHTFYLDRITSLDLVVEPLGDSSLFAHTMLSFGFGTEQRVVVSVEARRERGETFSVIGGIYRQYELFYQINNERDAFTLRALDPDANLYVYPVKAKPDFIRELFLDMMREAARLEAEPEFYHSLKANCTTRLFDHINRTLEQPISYSKEVLFPSKAGAFLHRLGWMDTALDYTAAKERFRLAGKVREFAEHPDFSSKIRE